MLKGMKGAAIASARVGPPPPSTDRGHLSHVIPVPTQEDLELAWRHPTNLFVSLPAAQDVTAA